MIGLFAEVTGYEDFTTSSGEVITMYMVNVQPIQLTSQDSNSYSYNNSTNNNNKKLTSYFIAKRYSEFAVLYNNTKDLIPRLKRYKFPNKSLFNNNSNFTKERRLAGFNELVNILCNMNPLPHEIVRFLDYKDETTGNKAGVRKIYSNNYGNNRGNSNNACRAISRNSNSDVDSIDNDSFTDLNAGNSREIARSIIKDSNSNYNTKGHGISKGRRKALVKTAKDRNYHLKYLFPDVLQSSMMWTISIYVLLVLLKFVDVSNNNHSQIVCTAISMGLLVTFCRMSVNKFVVTSE